MIIFFLHENGLLYANGKEKACYMDELYCQRASCNSSYRLYRRGEFAVYNALRFVSDIVREGGNDILADKLDAQAEITGKSFVEVFRNEYGYLFDYVDGYMMDWSVRPNMIFAVAF